MSKVSKSELVARYPELKFRIEVGDFLIEADPKALVWTNTEVFAPSFSDLEKMVKKEFPDTPWDRLVVRAEFMSLAVREKSKA